MFFAFNRFPKLDIVGADLVAVTAPQVQCFQGFCIERAETVHEVTWSRFLGDSLAFVASPTIVHHFVRNTTILAHVFTCMEMNPRPAGPPRRSVSWLTKKNTGFRFRARRQQAQQHVDRRPPPGGGYGVRRLRPQPRPLHRLHHQQALLSLRTRGERAEPRARRRSGSLAPARSSDPGLRWAGWSRCTRCPSSCADR